MELWIRSQDRKVLTPIKGMISISSEGVFYNGYILGKYKIKKRALEELDEIQECMRLNANFKGSVIIYNMSEE